MSMRGLCHVCGAPADFQCRNCHEPVCSKHLGEMGLCTACQRMGRKMVRT